MLSPTIPASHNIYDRRESVEGGSSSNMALPLPPKQPPQQAQQQQQHYHPPQVQQQQSQVVGNGAPSSNHKPTAAYTTTAADSQIPISTSPMMMAEHSPVSSFHQFHYRPPEFGHSTMIGPVQQQQRPILPYYTTTANNTPATTTTANTTSNPTIPQTKPQQPPPPSPQTPRELTPNTPWTLGSTDPSYAMKLVAAQEQQQLAALNEMKKKNHLSSGGGGAHESEQQQYRISSDLDGAAAATSAAVDWKLLALQNNQSLYQDMLFQQSSTAVEATLAAACEVMSFDIAEMWLRTGLKTHQLTNSHLRPTALDESTRAALVDVYYGEKSSERTHRLSPALCKRAKEANDVVWVSAQTERDAEALRCSISNVHTAVAVPICHEASNTNITIIFFSVRRVVVRPSSVEFLVHMALAAGVASSNQMEELGRSRQHLQRQRENRRRQESTGMGDSGAMPPTSTRSENGVHDHHRHNSTGPTPFTAAAPTPIRNEYTSVTGAPLDLHWRQLQNVEYLTDGGSSWVHTAVLSGRPVVVKTLKPECQDVAVAINEIESELSIHSRLDHGNVARLMGAGTTSKNVRFLVLERLDGGTLSQMLGYDTRIRDRRRRFWKRKHFSFVDMLRIARSIAKAMAYCHEEAIPGSIVIHRDLKPDNIGFTLDGTVKILDFGLAKVVENASVTDRDVYAMSGETGSLRYMAPEVAEGTPYNASVDVYSFGIILWELTSGRKPFEGLTRATFYEQVVHGGERPPIRSKWPETLVNLLTRCWDADMWNRPTFREILEKIDEMLDTDMMGHGNGLNGGSSALRRRDSGSSSSSGGRRALVQRLSRHTTWF